MSFVACGGGNQHKATAPTSVKLTTKQLVNQSKPSIVAIQTTFPDGRKATGTGFFISADGRIATNLHVVHGGAAVQVKLLDGSVFKVKTIHGTDRERDLAIIGIGNVTKRPTLRLADSDQVSAGERVVVIGNPLGVLAYTVSDGLISSVRRVSNSLTVLQISAPISHGSSGGPLFNIDGQVIGVATMIATRGQNLNFGVPSNYLRALMQDTTSISFAAYAKKFAPRRARIKRNVPKHSAAIFDGCSEPAIKDVYKAIGEAIDLGAPLYNKGNHEACFKIYRNAALRFQGGGTEGCKGLSSALGDGLLRASTIKGWTPKAWAMRDAFDGIIRAVMVRARNAGKKKP